MSAARYSRFGREELTRVLPTEDVHLGFAKSQRLCSSPSRGTTTQGQRRESRSRRSLRPVDSAFRACRFAGGYLRLQVLAGPPAEVVAAAVVGAVVQEGAAEVPQG